jgi:hypothetical protein
MRILIGNDTDVSLVLKRDIRAWTQRILWFAREGDLIILMSPPDKIFLDHVATLTGVDTSRLHFHIVPTKHGCSGMFDSLSLSEETFLKTISKNLNNVSEIIALWPSAQVARFTQKLGLSAYWSGFDFFAQNGGVISNSKANFRAFGAAFGIPIPQGAVCYTPNEAVVATNHFLETADALILKMEHCEGGQGNRVVLRNKSQKKAAIKADHLLQPKPDAVREFWEKQWDWASDNGRFAVIIEEFVPHNRSVYAEFFCSDTDAVLGETGCLIYEKRTLTKEEVPLRDLEDDTKVQLVKHGRTLAQFYRQLGYRGYLSVDAVVTPKRKVIFTEVNARFTSSTHLYEVIAHKIVNVNREPDRTIMQYTSPITWSVPNLKMFLNTVNDLGFAYNTDTRQGVIAAMPVIESETGSQVIFCVVSKDSSERDRMVNALRSKFKRLVKKK